VRTADDLFAAAGVPVLSVLPKADSKGPRRLVGNAAIASTPPPLRLGQ